MVRLAATGWRGGREGAVPRIAGDSAFVVDNLREHGFHPVERGARGWLVAPLMRMAAIAASIAR